MSGLTDSAGTPWAGRHFEPNPNAADDGSAPPAFVEAIARFRSGEATQSDVVDALRGVRLLVPLIANLGEEGENDHGVRVDKTQELSIVTVAGPDGRTVLPAFSCVSAMRAWNPEARPVPVDMVRVALAAASEATDLVVVDPTSESEFVIRRPAVWAIAQGTRWMPSPVDPDVAAAFALAASREPAVGSVRLEHGDPAARLAGPELVVRLAVAPGLERDELQGVVERLSTAWAEDAVIAERVDSLRVAVERA